jgi:hypothetical protein
MDDFQIDFTELANKLNPNVIPVRGNEKRITRVAFDLFRIEGDEPDDLWQVQADDDGNEFLVRTYSLEEDNNSIDQMVQKESDWSVRADKKYDNLTVSYKNVPLQRIATKEYNIETPEDGKTFQGILFNKLSSDKDFVFKFLNSLPKHKRIALAESFEEYQEIQDSMPVPMGNLASGLQEAEDDKRREDVIAEAYRLIEELDPGSKESTDLSELVWDVESDEEPVESLENLIEEISEDKSNGTGESGRATSELEQILQNNDDEEEIQSTPIPPGAQLNASDAELEQLIEEIKQLSS